MLMPRVASVCQKFRTLILLFPFLGISAYSPRVVRVSLKHIAVLIRQSYQRALEIVVGIQQGVVAAILYEQTSACKVVNFSDITNGICLFFVISEIIADTLSYTKFQLNAEVTFRIPKFIVSLHQQNQKQI